MWPLFVFAFWLMGAHCDNLKKFYIDLENSFKQKAVNCTRYIPADFRSLTVKYNVSGILTSEYLLACLNAELPKTNRTSPLELGIDPSIKYNFALNEVLSLGFDGLLVLKACPSLQIV